MNLTKCCKPTSWFAYSHGALKQQWWLKEVPKMTQRRRAAVAVPLVLFNSIFP